MSQLFKFLPILLISAQSSHTAQITELATNSALISPATASAPICFWNDTTALPAVCPARATKPAELIFYTTYQAFMPPTSYPGVFPYPRIEMVAPIPFLVLGTIVTGGVAGAPAGTAAAAGTTISARAIPTCAIPPATCEVLPTGEIRKLTKPSTKAGTRAAPKNLTTTMLTLATLVNSTNQTADNKSSVHGETPAGLGRVKSASHKSMLVPYQQPKVPYLRPKGQRARNSTRGKE